MDLEDLCTYLNVISLNTREVSFSVTLDGVYQHIPEWRVRQLNRIARFYEYGFATTSLDSA